MRHVAESFRKTLNCGRNAVYGLGIQMARFVHANAKVADGVITMKFLDAAALVDVCHEQPARDCSDVDGGVTPWSTHGYS